MTLISKHRLWWNRLLSLYLVIILFSLLVAATYTWFSISRTPSVSDMYLFANSQGGLELSDDPGAEEWQLQLDFRSLLGVNTVLRPITWSDQNQCFYAADYGPDGRRTGWTQLSDQQNANRETLEGYYIKASFYARSEQAVNVELSPAVEVTEGTAGAGTYLIGYPEWNSESIVHNNAGRGGECAVRIGFRTTPVNASGAATGAASQFIIYEPNCNAHIFGGSFGYIPTPSIDGTPTLVDESRLILQTASAWKEAYPVQRNVVMYELGEFTTNTTLFSLPSGGIARIDMYIWLEGQDVDCDSIVEQSKVLANIQLRTDIEQQSGMTPIR